MMTKRGIVESGLLAVFFLAGCVVEYGDIEPMKGIDESGASPSWKKMSLNKMSLNRMSSDAMSVAALEALAAGDMAALGTGEDSLELMFYAAKCALAGDDAVVFAGEVLEGNFGFAPGFPHVPFTADEEEWMTACLLAHVNAYEIAIPFSARGDHPVLHWPSAMEMIEYAWHEAGFAGNMFLDSDRSKFGCAGDDAWLGYASPMSYMGKRVCARDKAGNPVSSCGFETPGRCRGGGDHTTEWTQKDGGDVNAHRVAAPDPAATRTKAYRNLTTYLRFQDYRWQEEIACHFTGECEPLRICEGEWVHDGELICMLCSYLDLTIDQETGAPVCGQRRSAEGLEDITEFVRDNDSEPEPEPEPEDSEFGKQ